MLAVPATPATACGAWWGDFPPSRFLVETFGSAGASPSQYLRAQAQRRRRGYGNSRLYFLHDTFTIADYFPAAAGHRHRCDQWHDRAGRRDDGHSRADLLLRFQPEAGEWHEPG